MTATCVAPDALVSPLHDPSPSPALDGAAPGWAAPGWEAEWNRQYAGLLRYASHLLGGDSHAAEDALQETAIRLWRHPEVVSADVPLAGWLRTVVRHIIIDRSRRQRARPSETLTAPGTAHDQPATGWCDEAPWDVASWESVATMLSVLPPHHRDVVFGVYVRDRPVAAVAADLGIPAGTVKSRCHYALRRLRELA